MQLEDVVTWLDRTEVDSELVQSQWHKFLVRYQLVSPPPSDTPRTKKRLMDLQSTPRSKRQKTTDHQSKPTDAGEDEVEFATPTVSRPWAGPSNPQLFSVSAVPSFTHNLPPSSVSSRSQSLPNRSQSSSPVKNLRNLELNPDGGVETRVISFNDPLLPEQLLNLLSDLESCLSNGEGIISLSQQAEIEATSMRNREFRGIPSYSYAQGNTRDALGPTPTTADVEWIVAEARECHESRQNEAGWNMGVHFPLLHKAIFGPVGRTKAVGFAACTTAKILKEYFPTDRKMIDFCIYVDPKATNQQIGSSSIFQSIESLCRSLPAGTINHTDYFALRRRPIAISIETKKRSGQQDAAELQIGTWHKAQWKLLTQLTARSGGSLDKLPFLPGVIINGHEWTFVATTRDGVDTTLWIEQGFGTTSSVKGVYKLFWGLQRLTKWVEDVYWPWFLENVLRLEIQAE